MSNWQSLHSEGYSRASAGDIEAAERFLKQAIAAAEATGASAEVANSKNCLAVVYKQDGRVDEARRLFEEVIDLAPASGDHGSAYSGMAELLCENGDYEEALALFDKAVDNFNEYECGLDLHFAECSLLRLIPLLPGRVQERKLLDAEAEEIRDEAAEGLKVLNLTEASSPEKVIAEIDHYIDLAQDEILDHPEKQDFYHSNGEALAFLWGLQLESKFGWQWLYIRLGRSEVLSIASPDRSQVVYPMHFLCECLEDPELDCTIQLAFELLLDEDGAECAPGEYENIMESVFRIVPKQGRTRSLAAARLPE